MTVDDAPVGESTAEEGDVACDARVVELGPRGLIATGIPFLDHMIDQLTSHAQVHARAAAQGCVGGGWAWASDGVCASRAQIGVSLVASIGGVQCVPEVDYAGRADASGPETDAFYSRHDRSIVAAAGASLGSALAELIEAVGLSAPCQVALADLLPPSRFLAPLDEAVCEAVVTSPARGCAPALAYAIGAFGDFPRGGRTAVGTLRVALLETFWAAVAHGLECDLSLKKARIHHHHHHHHGLRIKHA